MRSDDARAIGQRLDQAVCDPHQPGRLGPQGSPPGLINHGAIAKRLRDEQLLPCIRTREGDLGQVLASPSGS